MDLADFDLSALLKPYRSEPNAARDALVDIFPGFDSKTDTLRAGKPVGAILCLIPVVVLTVEVVLVNACILHMLHQYD